MNDMVLKSPRELIEEAKPKFQSIIAADPSGVSYEKESMFAFQALTKNSYIMKAAQDNPHSAVSAVINIASVGLSLNPATAYAYLVPRDGSICLDISYKGLIKIATDSGSIKWAKADLVYQNDAFEYRGPAKAPTHVADPFSDRGEFTGVYCIAKTADGDILTEVMSAEEVNMIMNESTSMKSEQGKKYSPWTRYPGEMRKKACIKRASKTWPMSERHERIQKAVEIINQTEGSEWAEENHRFKPGERQEIITQMRSALANGDGMGVSQILDEYMTGDPEEQMKFWGLFSSTERSSIKAMTEDEVA